MNFFFQWLCNPIAIFIVLLLVSGVFHFLKKERTAFYLFSVGIGWVILTCTTPFPQWVAHSLENRYPVFDLRNYNIENPVYILILGGGHTDDPDMPASMKLSGTASVRLLEGIRIYNQIAGSKLVGSGSSFPKKLSLAEVQDIAAVELGVAKDDTLQNREPGNTAEEILSYKKRFGNKGTLILVTSAIHMPRAMILCEKYRVKAIPAPTEFYVKKEPHESFYDFKPSVRKLEMMESALHEYAGFVKAKWID